MKRYVDTVTQLFKLDADNTIVGGFSACGCRSCDRSCTGHKLRYTGHPKQVSSSEIMKLGGEMEVEDQYELKDKLRDTKAYGSPLEEERNPCKCIACEGLELGIKERPARKYLYSRRNKMEVSS